MLMSNYAICFVLIEIVCSSTVIENLKTLLCYKVIVLMFQPDAETIVQSYKKREKLTMIKYISTM